MVEARKRAFKACPAAVAGGAEATYVFRFLSRRLLTLAPLLLLAACAGSRALEPSVAANPVPGFGLCCQAGPSEHLPRWAVALYDPLATVFGPLVPPVNLTPGKLADGKLAARLERELRPLDILMVGRDGSVLGWLVPGLFNHVEVYLGNEAQLRRLGIWDDPRLTPYRDDIRAGKVAMESVTPKARLISIKTVADVDRLAVLRPKIGGRRKGEIVLRMVGLVGVPYDYNFDAAESARLFCAELVRNCVPELGIPARFAYGRPTVVPDDIVTRAYVPDASLELVLYARGNDKGVELASRGQLKADIVAEWQRLADVKAGSEGAAAR